MKSIRNLFLQEKIITLIIIFTLFLIIGCSGDETSNEDGDTDDIIDGDNELENEIEAEEESISDEEKTEEFMKKLSSHYEDNNFTIFAPLPGEPQKQVHPAAAFDSDGIWIVYNNFIASENNENSNGGIYLAKISAKQDYIVNPIKVSTMDDINNVDPALAVGKDYVTVVWYGDNGQQPYNLSIFYRQFDKSGNARSETEIKVTPEIDGTTIEANMWIAQITKLQNNAFAIAGSMANESSVAWQAFVQRIDADGNQSGDVILPDPNSENTQFNVALSANSSDTIFVSWIEQPASETEADYVVFTSIPAGSSTAQPAAPVAPAGKVMSGTPMINISKNESETVFLSYYKQKSSTNTDIIVQDISNLDETGEQSVFGTTGVFKYGQNVAPYGAGGALSWCNMTKSYYGNVFAQGFDSTIMGMLVRTEAFQLNENLAIIYYTPSLIAIAEDIYFAVWVEGSKDQNDETIYTLKSRFIDLSKD